MSLIFQTYLLQTLSRTYYPTDTQNLTQKLIRILSLLRQRFSKSYLLNNLKLKKAVLI